MPATRVRALVWLLALMLLLALPAAMLGHAALVSGDPAPGSTVDTAPSRVSATFDDELVPGKSSIVLIGPDGQTVGTGSLAPEDSHVLTVIVPPLGPGTYEVRWTAATADGHIERGTYRFTVATSASPSGGPIITAPPRSSPTPAPSAGPASTPAPSPEPSATPQPDGGGTDDSGLGLIVAAAVAGLVLGAVIGWWRRRQGR